MNDFIKRVSNDFWEFLETNQKRLRHILGTDVIIEKLALLEDIYLPAMVQHQKVFPKYKGINKGKTVVVVGTGPTFDYYEPIKNAVHMGLNNALFRDDIKFDYFFVADYEDKEYFDRVFSIGYDFKKFFGINYYKYNQKYGLIPDYLRERDGVEAYYVEGYNYETKGQRYEKDRKFVFPIDLSVSPFKSYGTSLYCVFQFALWTHPNKIYLVGADCSGISHAGKIGYKKINYNDISFDFRHYIRGWRKLKDFAEANYPDVEVISINPVGLKGIFKDEYTDSYKIKCEGQKHGKESL